MLCICSDILNKLINSKIPFKRFSLINFPISCERQQFSSLLKPTVEMKVERWNENKALENATKRLLSNHAFI